MNPRLMKKVLIFTGIGVGSALIGTQIPKYPKKVLEEPIKTVEPGKTVDPIVDAPKEPEHLTIPEYPKIEYPEKNRLLSKEYCESILRRLYKNDNIKVNEIQGGDKSSLQSFMSQVKKFKVLGSKEDGKFQIDLIVKGLHSKAHQDLFKSDIAAKNEAIAYNTIFPHLNVYEETTLPVPACYSAKDEKIIIEDLCGSNQGYQMFDKKKGYIDPNECAHILEALAKFHAAAVVLKHNNTEAFEKIKNLTKEFLYNNPDSLVLKHQQDCLKNIVLIYKRRNPTEENLRKIAALENLIRVAKYDIKDLLSEERENDVFCHGDLLLTNFLYRRNEKRTTDVMDEVLDIKFVDFQKVLYGSIASDLAHLLFVNVTPDDYINCKESFLHKYITYLRKNIEDCGVPVDPKLNFNWLESELDRFTEYGIIYALWVLPMFYNNDTPDGVEVTKEMLAENSRKIFINQRMEKWVDYYSEIFEKKSKV